MIGVELQRGHSSGAPTPRAAWRRLGSDAAVAVAVAALIVCAFASRGSALILTGGASYTLAGGGSCTVSGVTTQTNGATVSCTGVNLAAHTNVYFGLRTDLNVIGNSMTGAAPAAASAAVFRYSSSTPTSITYTSTTTISDVLNGTQNVNNTLVLTLVTGSATVVPVSGNPPDDNNNGDVRYLFHITGLAAGNSFSIRADVKASSALHSLGYAAPAVYDPTHTPATGSSDISKVDVGFYKSDCGDGQVDSPEQCDAGGSNGSATSCCTTSCQFRSAGQVCRPGAGAPCDSSETCTGLSGNCPPDDAPVNLGTVCRPGSGDICDQNETCTGVPGQGCPADDAPSNAGIVCRASSVGDVCDMSETCTGVPGATCPPDDAPAKINMVCRTGSGDICDPDERCTGVSGQGCPANVVANPATVCRTGSGDMCDPDEHCTAVPGQACPANFVTAAGTVCRASAGQCDVAEQCTGVAGQQCPTNAFVASLTPCDVDNNVCTIDKCDGNGSCVFNSNLNCEDGNTCTQDSCDPQTGCHSVGQPATNCRAAGKAVLKITDSSDDTKDRVGFLWRGGPALLADMGNPTQSTRYELCIYDNRGVQMAMGVPPGTNWGVIGPISSPKGYRYKDLLNQSNGVSTIKLKSSNLDKAQAKLAGKGGSLPDTEMLPFQFPVTAQLYASDGMCWEAQFAQSQAKKNNTIGFRGVAK
jgi:hypothetical protein